MDLSRCGACSCSRSDVIIFIIAAFAETNRTPFDLAEGESEIVAGFHVEYSSMKFALFFLGEYVAMFVSSALDRNLVLRQLSDSLAVNRDARGHAKPLVIL